MTPRHSRSFALLWAVNRGRGRVMKARGMVGGATLVAALIVVFVCGGAAFGQNDPNKRGDDSGPAVRYDVSPPLSAMAAGVAPEPDKKEKEKKKAGRIPLPGVS